jgi:hypothetical protein
LTPNAFYVLKDVEGRLLSFDPAKESFTVVESYSDLQIWDIERTRDERICFMGNTPRSKVRYSIVKIPDRQLLKLRYFWPWRQMNILGS